MKYYSFLILLQAILLIIFSGKPVPAVAQQSINAVVQQELDSILRIDNRNRWAMLPEKQAEYAKANNIPTNDIHSLREAIRKSDSTNMERLICLIDKHGYPGKSLVGEDRSYLALYLLLWYDKLQPYQTLTDSLRKNGEIILKGFSASDSTVEFTNCFRMIRLKGISNENK